MTADERVPVIDERTVWQGRMRGNPRNMLIMMAELRKILHQAEEWYKFNNDLIQTLWTSTQTDTDEF